MNPEERKQYIGGSDIANIMGLGHRTPLKVWAVKTGKIPEDDLSNVEAVQLGNELEPIVANWFSRVTGFKIKRDNRTFRHKTYDYMVGHIDRWIVGEDALLEVKTTGAWQEKKWEGDDIPQPYILQTIWYMGLLGKGTGYIAVLIGGQKRRWKQIQFNQELYDKMIESARIFWEENVLKNVPPLAMSDDADTLAQLFADVKESVLVLDEEQQTRLDQLVEERQGGIEQKKLIEEDLDKIQNQIKQTLGEYEQALTSQYAISWKKQGQRKVDIEKLKEAGLFEEYSKTTEFRVLRTKQLRGLK